MSDIRERLAEVLWEKFGAGPTAPLAAWLTRSDCERFADAILAGFDVTERGEGDLWEYGVWWGDDGTVKNYGSRELAEERASEPYGDKVVRRIAARTIPAGEWEEVSGG